MITCSRCGKEIMDTYQSEYFNCVRGMTWRTNTAYGKLNVWQPEQNKGEKPQTIVMCGDCFEEFIDFMEI